MNKKLLAAAIAAAAVAAPAAYAESTVYGKAHVSIDRFDYDGATKLNNYEVNSRASRLGFKGSEDLGNGLKAVYQIEFGVSFDENDPRNNMTGRNTYLGLSSDWGTVFAGKYDTPQKWAFYASGNERLGDSIIDLNTGSSAIGVFTENRVNNAIAYVSPTFAGFTFAGAIVPGEQNSGEASDLNDAWSLGLSFDSNGLKASVGYTDYSDIAEIANPNTDSTVLQAGATYTIDAFSFGGEYEDSEFADTDYTAWALTGKFTFGNNAVSAVYTDSDYDNNYDTQGWGLSFEHNFSKRTTVYVAYASNDVDYKSGGGDDEQDAISLGMIHNF